GGLEAGGGGPERGRQAGRCHNWGREQHRHRAAGPLGPYRGWPARLPVLGLIGERPPPNPYEGSVVKRENHLCHRIVEANKRGRCGVGTALDDGLLWRSCRWCQPNRRLHPTRIRTLAAAPHGGGRLALGPITQAGPDAVAFPTSRPLNAAGSS